MRRLFNLKYVWQRLEIDCPIWNFENLFCEQMIMQILRKCALMWITALFVGCYSPSVDRNRDSRLSESEYADTLTRAVNGDGDACFRMHSHWAFGMHNEAVGIEWLRQGQALGNRRCIDALKSTEWRHDVQKFKAEELPLPP